MSEAAFLAQQAAMAKLAIRRTLTDLKTPLQDATDVCKWTREYPWFAVGAASLLGYGLGSALTPTSRIDSADAQAKATEASQATNPPRLSVFALSLLDILRGILTSVVIDAFRKNIDAETDLTQGKSSSSR